MSRLISSPDLRFYVIAGVLAADMVAGFLMNATLYLVLSGLSALALLALALAPRTPALVRALLVLLALVAAAPFLSLLRLALPAAVYQWTPAARLAAFSLALLLAGISVMRWGARVRSERFRLLFPLIVGVLAAGLAVVVALVLPIHSWYGGGLALIASAVLLLALAVFCLIGLAEKSPAAKT